jgi:hypothetical protein
MYTYWNLFVVLELIVQPGAGTDGHTQLRPAAAGDYSTLWFHTIVRNRRRILCCVCGLLAEHAPNVNGRETESVSHSMHVSYHAHQVLVQSSLP